MDTVQPRLHPNLPQVYRDKVACLHEALQSGSGAPEALEKLRQIIERIVLTPILDAKGFEIELIGEIAAMVRLGLPVERADSRPISATDHALFESSVKMVAGTCNQFYLLFAVQGLRPRLAPASKHRAQ